MTKSELNFIKQNKLYTLSENTISFEDYTKLSINEQTFYIPEFAAGNAKKAQEMNYRKIIPLDTVDHEIANLCAIRQADNSAKSEEHLRTIKNIAVLLLVLDAISALLVLISNFSS